MQIIAVEPSWHRAGFAADPGDFVRKHPIDYAVCAAWDGWSARKALPAGYKLTAIVATPLPARGTTTNYGFLLPNNSHIAAIYCGASDGGAVSECSPTAAMHP